MKKIIIILSTSFLMLVVILLTSFQEVKALGNDNIFDDIIVANVDYNNGNVILSQSAGDVRAQINSNDEIINLLYIASFNPLVRVRIIAGSTNNFYYDVGMLAIVYDYNSYNDFYAYVTLYDTNGNVILDTSYNAYFTLGLSFYIDYEIISGSYNDGYDYGYEIGLEDGKIEGYDVGYDDGRANYGEFYPAGSPNGLDGWYSYWDGYDLGLEDGYDYGYDEGYDDGLIEQDTTYKGVFTIITNAIFTPIALIFGIEILPNISLGMIILVPLLFGLIAFVVGGKKK